MPSSNEQFTRFISNEQHYEQVIELFPKVKRTLWIGTADIKDVYVKEGTKAVPLLAVIDKLIRNGVEVRLLHAKEPGPAFKDDFDRYSELAKGLERAMCPRVHFKIVIFDCETAYIGSANLTGAGIGMKSDKRRNFEAGILTNDTSLVNSAIEQFDSVWRGSFCKQCGRREYCVDRIIP